MPAMLLLAHTTYLEEILRLLLLAMLSLAKPVHPFFVQGNLWPQHALGTAHATWPWWLPLDLNMHTLMLVRRWRQ